KSVTQTGATEQNVENGSLKLPYGESVTYNNVTLKFTEVTEDSRCPTGTTCVWAGRAIAKIEVISNGKSETKTVIFGQTRSGENANLQLYSGNGMSITAVSVSPYPDQNGAIAKEDYVVDISVE